MFSVQDIASEIGLNINTLRYWLKKNKSDCMTKGYSFDLGNLFQAINVYKKSSSRNNLFRKYRRIVVLDMDEFKDEFYKYFNYVKALKNKKRASKLTWTPTAVDCYNCKMDCNSCFNRDICQNLINEENLEPPMKNVVRKLLKDIGQPNKY